MSARNCIAWTVSFWVTVGVNFVVRELPPKAQAMAWKLHQ